MLSNIEDRAEVIVAVKANMVIGFVAFYLNDFERNVAYITLIAVDENNQNLGIGSLLINYLKQVAKINSFDAVRLEVLKKNTKAKRFYSKHCFVYEQDASEKSEYMICHL